ncbi:MAG TPA: acetoacetate--CoA ligase [Devosiaceae bacterium]
MSVLWTPSEERISASQMHQFGTRMGGRFGFDGANFAQMHRWSIGDREAFWEAIWDHCEVIGEKGGTILSDGDRMPGARFFPGARLNFAENLLRKSGPETALIFRGENKVSLRMSWDELRALVSRLQQAFAGLGVGVGDRVAGMMPNMPETVAAMLAATSLGAIWSSCSPDFGERGVLDRFAQISPKLFIAPDGYWYNGKRQDVREKVRAIAAELRPVRTVLVSYLGDAVGAAREMEHTVDFESLIAGYEARPLTFSRQAFDHPLYILFSSGTTGVPKCIVHGAGGTLLQHLKEHRLHCDIRDGDRLFYFSTCGWMMWNWLVSGLASGATLCLYDGSPFFPSGNVLFDYAEQERFAFFGTSAKFIDALRKAGLAPRNSHDLSALRTMASTGSPLAPENFRYVYEQVKGDLHLASISGGTDIVSCFVLGVPTLPVRVGEIQGPGLGMAVEVWDEDGRAMGRGKGELVCTRPFPSMPLMFWNDPEGEKYRAAYFERFENVWCHGDWAEWTESGGMIIHGRSDATLNPGGVRIGTAEIYNQVEQLPEVIEALCVGQDWDGDVRVVLFVRLADGVSLDEDLTKRIKHKIRTGASPRHVPAKVIAVSDIPRTKSGKITELAVREVIHGRPVKNREALANPEALSLFEALPELEA